MVELENWFELPLICLDSRIVFGSLVSLNWDPLRVLSVYEQFISPRLKVDTTSLVYLFITFSLRTHSRSIGNATTFRGADSGDWQAQQSAQWIQSVREDSNLQWSDWKLTKTVPLCEGSSSRTISFCSERDIQSASSCWHLPLLLLADAHKRVGLLSAEVLELRSGKTSGLRSI